MTDDATLADRVRARLRRRRGFSERRMFGGLCFMLDGRMCAGVLGERLIVRVAPQVYAAALARPHTGVFDFTGRPMKGFVVVRPAGCNTDARLAEWLEYGIRVARTGAAGTSRATARPRSTPGRRTGR